MLILARAKGLGFLKVYFLEGQEAILSACWLGCFPVFP